MSIFYCRLENLGGYTDHTRKRKRNAPRGAMAMGRLVLDSLKEPKKRQYGLLQRWVLGKMPNNDPWESGIGDFEVWWWLNLKTPFAWLEDTVRYLFDLSFTVIYICLLL